MEQRSAKSPRDYAAHLWIAVGTLTIAGVGTARGQALDDAADRVVRERIGGDKYTISRLDMEPDNIPLLATLVVDDVEYNIILEPVSIRAPGFRVRVYDQAGRLGEVSPPAPRTYRGFVEGIPSSHVEVSLIGEALSGQVVIGPSDDQTFSITPLAQIVPGGDRGAHVVYKVSDVSHVEGTCATPDARHGDMDLTLATRQTTEGSRSVSVAVCEIACDADYEYYLLNNGSVDDTVADIESLLNVSSAIYERDLQISLSLTEVIVRTDEADPYTSADPSTLLGEFRYQWRNYHTDVARDVAQLFTGRNLAGISIGIAYRPGVCSTWSGYSVIQALWTSNMAARMVLCTHEIGHNFNAGHCDDGDWWCRIMCSTNGGCAGRNSFSPWAIDLIVDYASANCLEPGTAELVSTQIPFFDDFDYSGDLDPDLWTGVDGTYLSTSGGDEPSPTRSARISKYYTMRTLPMAVDRPVSISYWTNHNGVEATSGVSGKSLKVEYFNTSAWKWQLLETVTSDGIDTPDFTYHEHRIPFDGLGEYFALRFSGYGAFADSSDRWYVDDVSVEPMYAAGDLNGDDAVELDDAAIFVSCMAGSGVSDPPGPCTATSFQRADLEQDDDVDMRDFSFFQQLFGADPVCGNGFLDLGEWCDDGGESIYCDSDCTLAFCGDGTTNTATGEECDDSGESTECNADCTLAYCGDGIVNASAGEECDDTGESYSCDLDCTAAICGDGTVNATRGEECDDAGESADCDRNCTFAVCGDRMVNPTAGEQCDDGGESPDCDVDCTFPVCGDGVLNQSAGEECDDGNTTGGDGCSALCTHGEPLPSCLISFDGECPNAAAPVCGATFEKGGMCVEATPHCVDSLPLAYELDGGLQIEFSGDVLTLSVAFWGDDVEGESTEGTMMFLDADWTVVDELRTDNCLYGPPPVHFFTFDRPVRYIEAFADLGPIWIDSMWINP